VKNLAVASALALILGLAGCTDFNYPVGIQQFGSVTGRLVDSTTQQPVGGPSVNVFCVGQATHPDSQGAFTVSQIPVGVQNCTVNAIGYAPYPISGIDITQGNTTQLGTIKLTATVQPGGSSG